ncbi:hypothetical protein NMY22_g19770 [Coprinellus aureogranulatus]|nr:hypothetical protein NMY22_g19770 [Coprinellus aureogranulatus]
MGGWAPGGDMYAWKLGRRKEGGKRRGGTRDAELSLSELFEGIRSDAWSVNKPIAKLQFASRAYPLASSPPALHAARRENATRVAESRQGSVGKRRLTQRTRYQQEVKGRTLQWYNLKVNYPVRIRNAKERLESMEPILTYCGGGWKAEWILRVVMRRLRGETGESSDPRLASGEDDVDPEVSGGTVEAPSELG